MVYGGIQKERVQTYECTFWAGGPRRLQKDGAYNDVVYVRKLIAEGKTAEAEKVINSKIVGPYYHSYMPFADINFDFGLPFADCSDYRRTLDMSNGIISVEYESDGKICGLKARGNLTVDIEWHGMKLDRAVIKGCSGQSVNVRYGNLLKSFIIPDSGKLVLDRMLNICNGD